MNRADLLKWLQDLNDDDEIRIVTANGDVVDIKDVGYNTMVGCHVLYVNRVESEEEE